MLWNADVTMPYIILLEPYKLTLQLNLHTLKVQFYIKMYLRNNAFENMNQKAVILYLRVVEGTTHHYENHYILLRYKFPYCYPVLYRLGSN